MGDWRIPWVRERIPAPASVSKLGLREFPQEDGLPQYLQKASFLSMTDSIGELIIDESGNGNDIPVVSGTTFEDVVVNVPTGHPLAGLGPFAADTDITISLTEPDAYWRWGTRGCGLWSSPLTVAEQARADRYFGADIVTPDYWIDENGDYLTDENGNRITI